MELLPRSGRHPAHRALSDARAHRWGGSGTSTTRSRSPGPGTTGWRRPTSSTRRAGSRAAALLPMQVAEAAAEELERAVVRSWGSAPPCCRRTVSRTTSGQRDVLPGLRGGRRSSTSASACHGGVHDGFGFDDFNALRPGPRARVPVLAADLARRDDLQRGVRALPRPAGGVPRRWGGVDPAWPAERFSESFTAHATARRRPGASAARRIVDARLPARAHAGGPYRPRLRGR